MSRTLSFKGTLAIGSPNEDRIRLRTLQGKVGYKIKKFQIISTTPGDQDSEFVAKITKIPDPNIGPGVTFTDPDLLAVAYLKEGSGSNQNFNTMIIFDNEMFNQDVYVNITDASTKTVPCNYYIEIETKPLSDIESTMLTLKNIRTVTSRQTTTPP